MTQTKAERAARKRLYKLKIWRQVLRPNQLRKEPRCRHCGEPATHVDHIEDHNMDMRKFRNPKNLQSLCTPCHSRKTRGAEALDWPQWD